MAVLFRQLSERGGVDAVAGGEVAEAPVHPRKASWPPAVLSFASAQILPEVDSLLGILDDPLSK
ncbi:MAG TPA: hypothetical protein VG295_13505 [Solirubrobacteraceae bacterium]|nr:hypothetical protein [Solirubrobacteraceae bacterium]